MSDNVRPVGTRVPMGSSVCGRAAAVGRGTPAAPRPIAESECSRQQAPTFAIGSQCAIEPAVADALMRDYPRGFLVVRRPWTCSSSATASAHTPRHSTAPPWTRRGGRQRSLRHGVSVRPARVGRRAAPPGRQCARRRGPSRRYPASERHDTHPDRGGSRHRADHAGQGQTAGRSPVARPMTVVTKTSDDWLLVISGGLVSGTLLGRVNQDTSQSMYFDHRVPCEALACDCAEASGGSAIGHAAVDAVEPRRDAIRHCRTQAPTLTHHRPTTVDLCRLWRHAGRSEPIPGVLCCLRPLHTRPGARSFADVNTSRATTPSASRGSESS